MHDLGSQARANVNPNTNFNKGWIIFKDCGKTDLLSHCDWLWVSANYLLPSKST